MRSLIVLFFHISYNSKLIIHKISIFLYEYCKAPASDTGPEFPSNNRSGLIVPSFLFFRGHAARISFSCFVEYVP